MTAVPDTSPFILLGRTARLALLTALYERVLIAPRVWDEAIVHGKEEGITDVVSLERAASELSFSRVRMTAPERASSRRFRAEGCGAGEAEVLAVARSRDAIAILDDKRARAMAAVLGVEHVGTIGVLYEAFLRKLLDYEELLVSLESLARLAWVSPGLLAAVLRKAREVQRE